MNTEGERLRFFLKTKDISIKRFCDDNDIAYNSFHQILMGGRNIGLITLKQVVKVYPDLNTNWVLFGKGDMELNTPDVSTTDPMFQLFLRYLEYPEAEVKILNLIKKYNSHGEK